MIHIQENFVNPDAFLQHQPEYQPTQPGDTWHLRTAQLPLELGASLLKQIHQTINQTLSNTVWADTINYARWRSGDSQLPHADGENADGSEHPYPWRQVGCVLYLNTNYQGGEIYFPDHNQTLKPEAGTLVWFPGTADYLHGVHPVTQGERITIASFWGENPPHRHWLYSHTEL